MSGELIMLQLNITMDSTSNNNALANELANMLPGTFRGLRARIRCMDHIVNIAARRAMLMLDASPKELARALDEATDDLERMGGDITDLGDAPATTMMVMEAWRNRLAITLELSWVTRSRG